MSETYLNPVYDHPFPDPFVLKYCGEYWAYCSGFWHDGRCFGVLHSRDLVHWRALAGAMEPLPERPPHYWAPEVTYENGRFLLYYSAGDEEHMHMRVAVAEQPAGPFVDSGRRLTAEPFAIDGHVFVDDDGARYLFYAADFLDRRRMGTGTVRDLMRDPFTLAQQPRLVTLPCYDWQIYDPRRAEKGGVCWHTVEGPFVLKRKGRYYQMFSGGNWQNISYGVSYAVSDRIDPPGEWAQVADGERVLPILRTLPGQVIGPGHNSVVRGPDNRQLFCVYHRWAQNLSSRVMAIDRLDWAGERMLVLGPSASPQPAPLPPAVADFFDTPHAGDLGANWRCEGGRWSARDGAAVQRLAGASAEARCVVEAPCFVAEVSARALDETGPGVAFGAALHDGDGAVLRCLIERDQREVVIAWRDGAGWSEQPIALPPEFVAHAYHLLRFEVDGPRVSVALDDLAARWSGRLDSQATHVALLTRDMAAAFAGFALTVGWQNLFTEPDRTPAALGWQTAGEDGWSVRDRQLWCADARPHAATAKGPPLAAYLLVVNARLVTASAPGGCYGFYPAMLSEDRGPLLTLERDGASWALLCRGPSGMRTFALPDGFDPFVDQQFRFHKRDGHLTVQWEAHQLGEIDAPREPTWVGLYAHQAVVAFDMVCVTGDKVMG